MSGHRLAARSTCYDSVVNVVSIPLQSSKWGVGYESQILQYGRPRMIRGGLAGHSQVVPLGVPLGVQSILMECILMIAKIDPPPKKCNEKNEKL